jgi:hypothetical protein
MLSAPTSLFFTLVAIIAYTTSNVAQIYMLDSPGLSLYGLFVYFLLSLTILSFTLLLVLSLVWKDVRILLPSHSSSQRRLFCCTLCGGRGERRQGVAPFAFSLNRITQTELLFLLGLNNALASLLQWYATPPNREPPLLNSVIPCLAVLCAVPFSKWFLGDSKHYLALKPLASFALIALGLAVSLLPSIIAGTSLSGDESALNVFLWSLINVISQLPSAAALVGTQAYLNRAESEDVDDQKADQTVLTLFQRKVVAILRFVAYNQISVATAVLCLFWLDFLPWFGSGDSPQTLFSKIGFAFQCSLNLGGTLQDCTALTPLWSILAVFPYIFYLSAIALVSADSAVYGNIVNVAQAVLQSIFFLIPGTNPNASSTPLWSTLLSVSFALGGVVLFKKWEAEFESVDCFPYLAAPREQKEELEDLSRSLLLQ